MPVRKRACSINVNLLLPPESNAGDPRNFGINNNNI